MFAYTCTCTVEHDRVIHHIDMSWKGAWDTTDQIRPLKIEGNNLIHAGAPG